MPDSQTIRKIQEEQGWTDSTLLEIFLDFLDSQETNLMCYILERCNLFDEED